MEKETKVRLEIRQNLKQHVLSIISWPIFCFYFSVHISLLVLLTNEIKSLALGVNAQ